MIQENITELLQNFTFAELWAVLSPLLLFILGIVVYAVFIFKFYRFVAKQDLFEMDIGDYTPDWKGFLAKIMHSIEYVVQYFLIFPILLFFWFGVLTVLLAFLTKSQSIQEVMLICVALIGAVRVTAYYDEDLSKDLAKMLPFGLLGIFLVDISYFNQSTSIELLKEVPLFWETALYYLVVIILIEFVLRIGKAIFGHVVRQ